MSFFRRLEDRVAGYGGGTLTVILLVAAVVLACIALRGTTKLKALAVLDLSPL